MNILFIDDTEQFAKKYVGIGGVIFHDDSIEGLCNLFRYKKKVHGIPDNEEIKWSPRRDSWIHKNLVEGKRLSAYSDILDLLNSFGGKVIVAIVQRDESKQSSTEAKWNCIEFITERFQFYLQSHEDKGGLIIADFPGSGTEEKQLLQDYYQLLDKGTRYVQPSNIVMNLLTTESHLNPPLQVADLVVGITTGMCTPHRDYPTQYWNILKRNFHRNQSGKVMGCGLKIFPSEIIEEIHSILFPEEVKESEDAEETYEEYIESQRYLYSAMMSEEELDMYFPRP